MNRQLVIILMITFDVGCTKENEVVPDGKIYTIEGRFYRKCGEPVSGANLILFQPHTSYDKKDGGELDISHTDDSGIFKFDYKYLNENDLHITYQGVPRMISIPIKKSIQNLDIYLNPTVNLTVRLDVQNTYTNTDTLKHSYLGNSIKLAGPFQDGTLLYQGTYGISDIPMIYPKSSAGIIYVINKGLAQSWSFSVATLCQDTLVYLPL